MLTVLETSLGVRRITVGEGMNLGGNREGVMDDKMGNE